MALPLVDPSGTWSLAALQRAMDDVANATPDKARALKADFYKKFGFTIDARRSWARTEWGELVRAGMAWSVVANIAPGADTATLLIGGNSLPLLIFGVMVSLSANGEVALSCGIGIAGAGTDATPKALGGKNTSTDGSIDAQGAWDASKNFYAQFGGLAATGFTEGGQISRQNCLALTPYIMHEPCDGPLCVVDPLFGTTRDTFSVRALTAAQTLNVRVLLAEVPPSYIR